MKSRVRFFAAAAFIAGLVPALVAHAVTFPWQDKDRALLQALRDNDLKEFEGLLKRGANPNAIFGKEREDWVMCLATDRGKVEFLKLGIDNGGDIDLRNTLPPLNTSIVQSSWSAPIFCAISHHSDEAFDYLLSKNAKLDILRCLDCNSYFKGRWVNDTPLTSASNNFRMVYQIISKRGGIAALTKDELESLLFDTKGVGYDRTDKQYPWHMKVIELLRAAGYQIEPAVPHLNCFERRGLVRPPGCRQAGAAPGDIVWLRDPRDTNQGHLLKPGVANYLSCDRDHPTAACQGAQPGTYVLIPVQ